MSSPEGSCVLSPGAMRHLEEISLVVFIDVPLKTIKRRLMSDDIDMRGIVGLKKMALNKLFDIRRPLYQRSAHLVVGLDDRPIPQSLDILTNKIVNYSRQQVSMIKVIATGNQSGANNAF